MQDDKTKIDRTESEVNVDQQVIIIGGEQ